MSLASDETHGVKRSPVRAELLSTLGLLALGGVIAIVGLWIASALV